MDKKTIIQDTQKAGGYLGISYALTAILIFWQPSWTEIETELLVVVNVLAVLIKKVLEKWIK